MRRPARPGRPSHRPPRRPAETCRRHHRPRAERSAQPAAGHPRRSAVSGLVPGDDVRRNPAAVADRDAHRLRPRPDAGAVLAVRGRSPFDIRRVRRGLARVLGVTADRLVESAAVHRTQIDLVVAAVEAEPPHPMLALWNLCLVVVTRICDRNLLCHSKPPFPCSQILNSRRPFSATAPRSDVVAEREGPYGYPGRPPLPRAKVNAGPD